MLENDSPPKTFLGVRFVLLGFDPINKEKIRSKLVSEGGVDAVQYRQDCTHVVVDKLVYDDPACVAAREDGKMVVTAMWVDHSYDVGVLLDATSVMYRPRKDLNGIPGARDFIMCLTGYQRQDREDIMTMVGLMGAQFSKPLVANKVTHLICYKFEGEKYELAKKMKKIKLVNHRWLEDCLTEWVILPEANYEKSGYDLEMEAEAKDSEDEAEGTDVKQFKGKSIYKSPYGVKTSTTKLLPDASTSSVSLNAKDVLRTPVKDNRSPVAAKLDNLDVSGVLGYQHVPAQRVETFGDPANSNVRTPDSTRVRTDLKSDSRIAEKSPHSDLKSDLSYSRKTPRRTSLSMYSVGNTRAQLDEFMINDCSNSFLSKLDQVKDRITTNARSPQQGRDSSTLPQKRKMDNSSATPMPSLHKSNDAKPSISGIASLSDKASLGYNDLSVSKSGSIAENSFAPTSTSRDSSFTVKPSTCVLPFVQTPHGVIDSTDGKPQTSFERLEDPTSHSKADTNGFVIRSADGENGKKQDKQQDVDHCSKGFENEVSHSPLQCNLPNEGNNSLTKKPLRRKTLAKKNSGSRSKLCKPANMKGSIYLNESATQNDEEIYLSGGKGRSDQSKSFPPDKFEVSPPTCKDEGVKTVVEADDVAISGGDVEKKTESMDEETEAPDDQYNHDFGYAGNGADTVMNEQPIEVQVQTSTLNETNLPDTMVSMKLTNKVESEKAECSKNLELGELTCKVGGVSDKKKKKKCSLGKTNVKSTPTVKEIEDLKEHEKGMASAGMKKESGVSKLAAETNKSTVRMDLNDTIPVDEITPEKVTNEAEFEKADCVTNVKFGQSTCKVDGLTKNTKKGKKRPLGKTKVKSSPVKEIEELKEHEKSMASKGMEKEGVTEKSTVMMYSNDMMPADEIAPEKVTNEAESDRADCVKNGELRQSTCKVDGLTKNTKKGKKRSLGKTKTNSAAAVNELEELKVDGESARETEIEKETSIAHLADKENKPVEDTSQGKDGLKNSAVKSNKRTKLSEKSNPNSEPTGGISIRVKSEPVKFILSGHRFQRKEFQQVIRRLKGKVCRDSHQWSYEATHFIAPDPIRRTEKFFAAAASGRWILKMDYLTACNQAGKLLAEESYEWHKSGLSEDGAINLEAPRKWRLLRERTGHGAFFGMRIIIYGECIAPPLDTLKRAVKAGDGTILATSPPYNRFLSSGVDFAIVSPGMPRVDMWVQEFLRHEIPCVAADYLVEYVCKPGYSLEKHVLYNTHAWAEKSSANLLSRAETIVEDIEEDPDSGSEDITCQVCGSGNRGDVMLICGNESGSLGCGVGTHIDCCDPPLENVPKEDWFCQKCTRKGNKSKTSDNSRKKRKK